VAVLLVGNALLALMEALDVVADPQVGTSGLVWLALVVVAPVLVIRRILAHRVVAMRTVLGAVTAYVQIAVAYAVLFRTVDAWSSAPFFGSPEPSTTYMYASLTTIATLGLGDVVPVGDVPRLVLASEAVLGQVFLVTVVAVVVSRFAEGRR
jgi:cobalamin synthase